jgi:hypothetical protein
VSIAANQVRPGTVKARPAIKAVQRTGRKPPRR